MSLRLVCVWLPSSTMFLQVLKSAFLVGGGGYILSPKNGGDLYERLVVVGIK